MLACVESEMPEMGKAQITPFHVKRSSNWSIRSRFAVSLACNLPPSRRCTSARPLRTLSLTAGDELTPPRSGGLADNARKEHVCPGFFNRSEGICGLPGVRVSNGKEEEVEVAEVLDVGDYHENSCHVRYHPAPFDVRV